MSKYVEMPQESPDVPGLVYNNRTNDSHFGLPETVAKIEQLGRLWAEEYPQGRMSIGQMSRQGGGVFPPHKTHRDGKTWDMRPMRKDLANASTSVSSSIYSRSLTEALIRHVRANAAVKVIYFNDPVMIAKGLTRHAQGHDNHLHVQLV